MKRLSVRRGNQMKFKIEVPIYKTTVFVVVGESDEVASKYFKRFYLDDEGIQGMRYDNGTEARVFLSDSRLCYVRFGENPTHECIAHELMHVTFDILRKVGIYHTSESEESYAYLLDYLVKEFYKKSYHYSD